MLENKEKKIPEIRSEQSPKITNDNTSFAREYLKESETSRKKEYRSYNDSSTSTLPPIINKIVEKKDSSKSIEK